MEENPKVCITFTPPQPSQLQTNVAIMTTANELRELYMVKRWSNTMVWILHECTTLTMHLRQSEWKLRISR